MQKTNIPSKISSVYLFFTVTTDFLYRIVGGFDCNIHVVRMALFETGRRNLHEDTVVFQGFDIGSTAIAHTR